MNALSFTFRTLSLAMLPSGALWWPRERLLCVSDLHLGKTERIARRGGTMLPPYETRDTLERLESDIAASDPALIISLGDSFDDDEAGRAIADADRAALRRLSDGRRWIWIAGNHDPNVPDLPGAWMHEMHLGPLAFRHIAAPGAEAEVSGHYHPCARFSARGARITRRCLLHDDRRIILPAYGTYTGGLDWTAPVLRGLLSSEARALLVGPTPCALPVPVHGRATKAVVQ